MDLMEVQLVGRIWSMYGRQKKSILVEKSEDRIYIIFNFNVN
jgi:hypothetical protein